MWVVYWSWVGFGWVVGCAMMGGGGPSMVCGGLWMGCVWTVDGLWVSREYAVDAGWVVWMGFRRM